MLSPSYSLGKNCYTLAGWLPGVLATWKAIGTITKPLWSCSLWGLMVLVPGGEGWSSTVWFVLMDSSFSCWRTCVLSASTTTSLFTPYFPCRWHSWNNSFSDLYIKVKVASGSTNIVNCYRKRRLNKSHCQFQNTQGKHFRKIEDWQKERRYSLKSNNQRRLRKHLQPRQLKEKWAVSCQFGGGATPTFTVL